MKVSPVSDDALSEVTGACYRAKTISLPASPAPGISFDRVLLLAMPIHTDKADELASENLGRACSTLSEVPNGVRFARSGRSDGQVCSESESCGWVNEEVCAFAWATPKQPVSQGRWRKVGVLLV